VTEERAREAMARALGEVAPEADPSTLADDLPFQRQLDIDSMDFLGFVVALCEDTGIDIPERDYPRVATPASLVAYLVAAGGR
jgi:acyl carrier protein